jgi:outer membrane protein assembly factor BamB
VDVRPQKIVAMAEMATVPSLQWPQWQGPTRNNKSSETGLLKQWPEGGPKQLWIADGLGQGYSTVAVAGGKIYTTGAIDKEGRLFCLDLDGKPLWQQNYGPEWSRSIPGVRCTPTVNDGRVYVISGTGQVACFNALTGEKNWQVDPFTEYGGIYGNWGIAESPLIVGSNLIFTVGGKETMLVALDKNTGKTVWTTPGKGEPSAYCSPLAFGWAGKTRIAGMTAESLFVVNAEDGLLQWSFPISNYVADNRKIHPNTPVFENGRLYFTSGYNMGGIQFQLSEDGKTVTETWRDTVMDNHHGSVILHEGCLYGANWDSNGKGDWVCLDWNTGKVRYTQNWLNKGCLTFADGMLYCYEEKGGTVGLVPAVPEGFKVVSSFVVTQGQERHWAHPVVCGKRLYLRHGSVLAAYDIAAPDGK